MIGQALQFGMTQIIFQAFKLFVSLSRDVFKSFSLTFEHLDNKSTSNCRNDLDVESVLRYPGIYMYCVLPQLR